MLKQRIAKNESLGSARADGWQKPLVLRGIMFVLLFGLWLVFSGKLVLEFLVLGALASTLVVFMTSHLTTPSRAETYEPLPQSYGWLLLTFLRFLVYLPWLVAQIVIANLQVTYQILHPKLPVSPRLLHFRTRLRAELPQLLLAQSITLTPGTITVDLSRGQFLIHVLSEPQSQVLAAGEMQQRVADVFGERLQQPPVVRAINVSDVP
jgi:multicomponent Na+:H+ antiporter subunit E